MQDIGPRGSRSGRSGRDGRPTIVKVSGDQRSSNMLAFTLALSAGDYFCFPFAVGQFRFLKNIEEVLALCRETISVCRCRRSREGLTLPTTLPDLSNTAIVCPRTAGFTILEVVISKALSECSGVRKPLATIWKLPVDSIRFIGQAERCDNVMSGGVMETETKIFDR